jgi:hypothetical protein
MSNWTQPQCAACWIERHPDRQPVRVVEAKAERCAFCGRITRAGIYVRVNPASVPYPREGKD